MEERFIGLTDDEHYNVVKDLQENRIYDDANEIATLLNKLISENELLRKQL